MVLSDINTYRQVIGCLMKKPLLLTEYQDIQVADFDLKIPRLLFAIISNMTKQGAMELSPMEVDLEIDNHETWAVIYKNNKGLDFLKESYELAKLENFEYYYKRLKKLALLRELKKNNFDISLYYKETFDTLKEEEEANKRFEDSSIDQILTTIEARYNKIKADFTNGGKHSGNAAAGLSELVYELMKNPEIGPSLCGSYFSTACRGARLGKYYLRSASSGTGKAITNSTKIPMADGTWKTVGEVKVGDYLIGKNGKPTKVLMVHPQKELKQVYELVLKDGRKVECCEDHLWTYYCSNNKLTTSSLKVLYYQKIKLGLQRSQGNYRYRLPINEPVDYQEKKLVISPYVMGKTIKENDDKCIPLNYLYGSINQRKELLRGLGIDVDDKKIKFFNTDNEKLNEQIKQLIYSLGYIVNDYENDLLTNTKYNLMISFAKYNPIVDIIKTNRFEKMTCFTVDAKDALFLVGDYVVTHNTRLAVFDACNIAFPIHFSYDNSFNCFIAEKTRDGSIREPRKTLVITTEMGKDEIQTIVLAYLSGVNESHILTAQYETGELDRVLYASQIVERYQDYFYIEEISDPNLTNIESTIKRYATIEGVQYVFYDYIFSSPSLVAQFADSKLREDGCVLFNTTFPLTSGVRVNAG